MELCDAYNAAKEKVDEIRKDIAIVNMVGCANASLSESLTCWEDIYSRLTDRMKKEAPFYVRWWGNPLEKQKPCIELESSEDAKKLKEVISACYTPRNYDNILVFEHRRWTNVQMLLTFLDPSLQALLPRKCYENTYDKN